jgi:phosphomannomutase
MLQANGWVLGGETSGHIICLDLTTTGDGLISALQVLDAMMRSGNKLSALKAGMMKFPQRLINVRLPVRQDVTNIADYLAANFIAFEGVSGRWYSAHECRKNSESFHLMAPSVCCGRAAV